MIEYNFETFYEDKEDIEHPIKIKFFIEPEEKQTWDYPGCPAELIIEDIVGAIDVPETDWDSFVPDCWEYANTLHDDGDCGPDNTDW